MMHAFLRISRTERAPVRAFVLCGDAAVGDIENINATQGRGVTRI
jgi:hypothetical protein